MDFRSIRLRASSGSPCHRRFRYDRNPRPAARTFPNALHVRVMVPSSTTRRASCMSCSRLFTWPGVLASVYPSRIRSASVPRSGLAIRRRGALRRDAVRRVRGPPPGSRFRQRLDAPEQRRHPRHQVRQGDVLGEVIVGPRRRPETMSKSLSRADGKMIGTRADKALSSAQA